MVFLKRAQHKKLEDILCNDRAFVNITGEFGTGKTTSLKLIVDYLRQRGYKVIEAKGTKENGAFGTLRLELEKLGLDDWIKEPYTNIEAIFLTDLNGLSLCSRTKSGVDTDIIGGMVSAVQNFVRDSFSQAGKEFKRKTGRTYDIFQYEDATLAVLRTDYCALACMFVGDEPEDFKIELGNLLDAIEAEAEKRAKDTGVNVLYKWDGREEDTVWIGEFFEPLMKKYDGFLFKGSADDKKLFIANKFLKNFEKNPLAIVIDDVENADDETKYLLSLIPNVDSNAIVVVSSEKPLGFESYETIEMENLTEEEFKEFVSSHFAFGKPPEEFVKKLYDVTKGNPFLVNANLEKISKEGINIWETHPDELKLYSSFVDVIKDKLKKYGENVYNVLEYASILGKFKADELSELLGRNVTAELVSFVSEGILSGEEGVFYFSSGKVREFVYNGIKEPKIYLDVAKYYEEKGEDYKKIAKLYAMHAKASKDKESFDKAISLLKEWAINVMEQKEPFSNEPFDLARGIIDIPTNLDELLFFNMAHMVVCDVVQDSDLLIEVANDTISLLEKYKPDAFVPLAFSYAYMAKAKYRKRKLKDGLVDAKKAFELLVDKDPKVMIGNKLIDLRSFSLIFMGYNLKEIAKGEEDSGKLEEIVKYFSEASNTDDIVNKIQALVGMIATYLEFSNSELISSDIATQESTKIGSVLHSLKESDIPKQAMIKIFNGLTYLYLNISDYEKAVEICQEGLNYCKSIGYLEGEFTFANYVAWLSWLMGEYDATKNIFDKYYHSARIVGHTIAVYLMENLYISYLKRGIRGLNEISDVPHMRETIKTDVHNFIEDFNKFYKNFISM